jgi:hypothetical protein
MVIISKPSTRARTSIAPFHSHVVIHVESTTIGRMSIRKGDRQQHSKQRLGIIFVKPRRAGSYKLVDSIFAPLHEQCSFNLDKCVDDEDLNVHGNLPHCSPTGSILRRELYGERVLINPPCELADEI